MSRQRALCVPTDSVCLNGAVADQEMVLSHGVGADKELVRQLSILTGSQLILNLGYAQLVPVMPLFAAE